MCLKEQFIYKNGRKSMKMSALLKKWVHFGVDLLSVGQLRPCLSFRNRKELVCYLEEMQILSDAGIGLSLFFASKFVHGRQVWNGVTWRKQHQQIGRQILRHLEDAFNKKSLRMNSFSFQVEFFNLAK